MSDEAEGIDLEGFEGHTPGPWESDLHLDEGDTWRTIEAEIPGVKRFGTVADTLNRDCCIDPDEDRANAALLAAAPRLLAEARESRSRIAELEAEIEGLREERDALLDFAAATDTAIKSLTNLILATTNPGGIATAHQISDIVSPLLVARNSAFMSVHGSFQRTTAPGRGGSGAGEEG
jgi:hypothetical protein